MILVLNMQNFLAVADNQTEARKLFLEQVESLAFSRPAR